jgi:hypothetical protein
MKKCTGHFEDDLVLGVKENKIIPSILGTNLNGFVLLSGVCNGAYVKDP